MRFTVFILYILLFLSACQSPSGRSLEGYYYPVDQLETGEVYAYLTAGEPSDPPFYWYFRSIEQEGRTFLTGMYYDHEFTPFQFIREEKVDNGMVLIDQNMYEALPDGKQRQIPVEVSAGNVFPFYLDEPDALYISKISWHPGRARELRNTVIRNRQYLGDTTWTYHGKSYDCVRFYVRELVVIEKGGTAEYEFGGEEIYAKGLGLVYFRKDISDDFQTEYRLADQFSMAELERRFGARR